MNKYLYTSIIYWLFSLVLIFIIFAFNSPIESLLAGFAGASFVGGSINLWHFYQSTRPENKEEYEEKQKNWETSQADQEKEALRDRAGRIAYKIGLVVIALAIVGFVLLDNIYLMENALVFVMFLLVFLLFQYFVGILIFQKLTDRYEEKERIQKK